MARLLRLGTTSTVSATPGGGLILAQNSSDGKKNKKNHKIKKNLPFLQKIDYIISSMVKHQKAFLRTALYGGKEFHQKTVFFTPTGGI